MNKTKILWWTMVLALLLAFPWIWMWLFHDRYFLHLIIISLIYVIFSSSWNLVAGYAGQLNMGHAAFFGIGAYTSALVSMELGISPWIGLLLGGCLSAGVGCLVGIPSLRLSGPYLAITTIGLAEILRMVAMNWVNLTRGSLGLYGIPPLPGFLGIKFTKEFSFYYVALAATGLTLYCIRRLTHSEFGMSLKAMRDDGIGAESIGIDTNQFKLAVFTVSAFFCGLSGGLMAHYQRLVSPDFLSLGETFQGLTMTVIGGLGTMFGPVIGSVLLTFLSEGLRFVEDAVKMDVRMIIYGLMLMLTILFMPGGMVGLWRNIFSKKDHGKLEG